MSLSIACGSSGSSNVNTGSDEPLVLIQPNSDFEITRADIVDFSATMPSPDDYTRVEFYIDLDEKWQNGNEMFAAFANPAAEINAQWDSIAADPAVYNIVIVLYSGGTRRIGYAGIKVTVTGTELFTLSHPSESTTITQGNALHLEGALNSEGFSKVEFYLDPDNNWGNGNEFLLDEFEPDAINGDWDSTGTEIGTYTLVVVLYREHKDRFIGYLDISVTIGANPLP